MTAPTPQQDTRDAQEFVTDLATALDDRGYHASAAALRAEMPDSDVTNSGGMGSEKVIAAIVESVAEQIAHEKNK
ncbi:MAG TPA: hypothetical protein VJT31_38935 [Rugosimonospora sp.]|nr:hypothetical protein [Rugosimonospora sp.]